MTRRAVLLAAAAALAVAPATATPAQATTCAGLGVQACADASVGCWHWAFGICKGAHASGYHTGLAPNGVVSTTMGGANTCTGATSCNTYVSVSGANLCGMTVTAVTVTATASATDTATLFC